MLKRHIRVSLEGGTMTQTLPMRSIAIFAVVLVLAMAAAFMVMSAGGTPVSGTPSPVSVDHFDAIERLTPIGGGVQP